MLAGEQLLERRDAPGAELGARGLAQLVQRGVEGAGRTVDAGREHRVEGVGDVDDPRAERDVLAREAVGIAGAVEALVVMADRRDGVAEEAQAVDDPPARCPAG